VLFYFYCFCLLIYKVSNCERGSRETVESKNEISTLGFIDMVCESWERMTVKGDVKGDL
jgi:hypothetical protein